MYKDETTQTTLGLGNNSCTTSHTRFIFVKWAICFPHCALAFSLPVGNKRKPHITTLAFIDINVYCLRFLFGRLPNDYCSLACCATASCTLAGSARDHFAHLLLAPPGGLVYVPLGFVYQSFTSLLVFQSRCVLASSSGSLLIYAPLGFVYHSATILLVYVSTSLLLVYQSMCLLDLSTSLPVCVPLGFVYQSTRLVQVPLGLVYQSTSLILFVYQSTCLLALSTICLLVYVPLCYVYQSSFSLLVMRAS